MYLQFALIFAIGCGLAGNVSAKTVETQSIQLSPLSETEQPLIPADALKGLETEPGDGEPLPPSSDKDVTAADEDTQPVQVLYNTDMLPKPVARMHAQMREVALSGEIERFRVVLESNEVMPTLSFGEFEDPIEFLKQSSGDGEGFEILAILADTLDAGFVHVDVGTPQEMYVWPYFARHPLFNLTPDQKVEMFRIVTAGDFAEMQDFGAWLFYRVGIGPDGTLHYFVAGD
ncbi:MAG: hypothetical protein ABJN98_10915 [Roseibium sp.]